MKYRSVGSAQKPILSDDGLTVVGWNLGVGLTSNGLQYEQREDWYLSEDKWFPVSEIAERVSESTLEGILALDLYGKAERELERLLNL